MSLFDNVLGAIYSNLAIDLGTANIVISHRGTVIIDEPSIVAFDRQGKLLAVGREALLMHEKTHNDIVTIKPLKDGVIANFKAAECMIEGLIEKAITKKFYLFRPLLNNVIVGIPSGITDVEKRAVKDFAEHTGARNVYMVYEPIASMIGADVDISKPQAAMIIDIGGGTSEIAVIVLSGIVCGKSIKVAGNQFTSDIIQYVRQKYNVLIGDNTGERIKISVGAVRDAIDDKPEDIRIYGRDLSYGTPKEIIVSYRDVTQAVNNSITTIENSILQVLEVTPPEISGDLHYNGIFLSGGGALLRGLPDRIREKTGIDVHVLNDPLKGVARGINKIVNDIKLYRGVLIS